MDVLKLKDRNSITLIGIGIFGWLSINSLAYLFYMIIRDSFFIFSISSRITIWTTTLIVLVTIVLGILILMNVVLTKVKSAIILFRNLIFLFILIQALQFAEPFLISELRSQSYFINYENFNELLIRNSFYQGLSVSSEFLSYLFTAIIILMKRQKAKNIVTN